MSCTLKISKFHFFEISYCDLVTSCHDFCISYRLAHVLNNFQLLTVSRTLHQIYKYCNFLASCATPLCSLLGKDLHKCLFPNFKFFFRSLSRIHTKRFINLLLWYEYHCVLRSKQRFLTIFCRWYTVRVQWQKHQKLRLHRG